MVDVKQNSTVNIKKLVGINGEFSFCPEVTSTRLTHESGKSSGLFIFNRFFVRDLPEHNRTATVEYSNNGISDYGKQNFLGEPTDRPSPCKVSIDSKKG